MQLPLPQEDDYNRHWSVLRQTIRLIDRMTICRTLMELSSLTGHLKVKHVRMFAKDVRTVRTFVRILMILAQILLSCCAMFLCTNTTQAHSIIKYTCLRQGLGLNVFGEFLVAI